jgi:hypothetical protein
MGSGAAFRVVAERLGLAAGALLIRAPGHQYLWNATHFHAGQFHNRSLDMSSGPKSAPAWCSCRASSTRGPDGTSGTAIAALAD